MDFAIGSASDRPALPLHEIIDCTSTCLLIFSHESSSCPRNSWPVAVPLICAQGPGLSHRVGCDQHWNKQEKEQAYTTLNCESRQVSPKKHVDSLALLALPT